MKILTGKCLPDAFNDHFVNITTDFDCEALGYVDHTSSDSFFLNPLSDEVAIFFKD